MLHAPRRSGVSSLDLQVNDLARPVRTSPQSKNMGSLFRPTLSRILTRILLTDPAASTWLGSKRQAAVLLAVPPNPASRRVILPQADVAEKETTVEHQSAGGQRPLGELEQASPIRTPNQRLVQHQRGRQQYPMLRLLSHQGHGKRRRAPTAPSRSVPRVSREGIDVRLETAEKAMVSGEGSPRPPGHVSILRVCVVFSGLLLLLQRPLHLQGEYAAFPQSARSLFLTL